MGILTDLGLDKINKLSYWIGVILPITLLFIIAENMSNTTSLVYKIMIRLFNFGFDLMIAVLHFVKEHEFKLRLTKYDKSGKAISYKDAEEMGLYK